MPQPWTSRTEKPQGLHLLKVKLLVLVGGLSVIFSCLFVTIIYHKVDQRAGRKIRRMENKWAKQTLESSWLERMWQCLKNRGREWWGRMKIRFLPEYRSYLVEILVMIFHWLEGYNSCIYCDRFFMKLWWFLPFDDMEHNFGGPWIGPNILFAVFFYKSSPLKR